MIQLDRTRVSSKKNPRTSIVVPEFDYLSKMRERDISDDVAKF